jgi:glycosyltransferase involved in cell wall biosynthesis
MRCDNRITVQMKIGVFHPGTQHSWQTALALQQLGRLEWFATSLFYKPDEWPYRIERYLSGSLRKRVEREFSRLAMPELDPQLVHTVGAIEWLQRITNRMGMRETALRLDAWGNRTFVRHLARFIAAPGELGLWGYSGSARASFAFAKPLGRTLILDRTIGDHRAYNRMTDELQANFGEWFVPVERRVPNATIASDEEEYALADHILVGCEYAARTLREWSTSPGTADKIRVLDYCFNASHFAGIPAPSPVDRKRPVRFLFLGLVIPRKGIQHVLEAIARIPASEAELTIVGDMKIPPEVFARFAGRVTYRKTVPRFEVPQIMAAHDVLLLPTYHEGAGIVLYEALAAGMGIIQSDRAALVATDRTGIILDRLDSESLLEAMRVPIEDRDRLDGWRAAAQGESMKYTFARYRDNISAFLAEEGI